MKLLLCTLVLLSLGYTYAQTTCSADVVILVDQSGSITDRGGFPDWYRMTNFTQSIVEAFTDSRFQIISFGNNAEKWGDFTGDAVATMQHIADMRDGYDKQFTNTSAALVMAGGSFDKQGNDVTGDRPDYPDVVIMITDGEPTYGLNLKTEENDGQAVLFTEAMAEAAKLKAAGIFVITVAVAIDNQEARNLLMTIPTAGNFLEAMNFENISAELGKIVNQTCTTIQPVLPCRQFADIYFIIDSSGSIRLDAFIDIKLYIARVMHRLPVGQGTRVGVLYYSADDFMGFNLLAHEDPYTAGNATVLISYMKETTNTAAVLQYLYTTAFTVANGDRPDFPNIAVILTDGGSNVRREMTLQEAQTAKMRGIHIISVGVSDWFDLYELQGLASDPYSSNYFHVMRTGELVNGDTYVLRLKALLCNDVNECSPNPCALGSVCEGMCVDKIGDFTCYCPDTCAGTFCERNCAERVDAAFLLDSSSSMTAQDFRWSMDFVGDVLDDLNMASSDSVALLRFSLPNLENPPQLTPLFNFNSMNNVDAVKNAITMDFPGGSTNTYDAINVYINQIMTTTGNHNKVLIIVTDGRSMNYTSTWDQARLAREAGVSILVVAVGQQFRDWNIPQSYQMIMELQAMASGYDNVNVFYVDNFNSLPQAVTSVSNAVCNNVGECENINCFNSGTPVDSIGYCECDCPQTQPEFAGAFCERSCTGILDIVLVIDSSGSMRNDRFAEILIFLSEFIRNFPVRAGTLARFGAVYFSDEATIAFHLNKYTMMEDIITHIRTMIPFLGGKTNIADALGLVEGMFIAANGDRANAKNFVFIITDGASNIKAESTIPNAISLRESTGAKCLILGIGNHVNTLELRGMASEPLANFLIMAPSFNSIINDQQMRLTFLASLTDAACNSVNECDGPVCDAANTNQCVDDYHSYYCDCRQRRSGRSCARECPAVLDVALVLDFSGSLVDVQDNVVSFAKEFVYGLTQDMRLGVVTYDSAARVNFRLNTYTSRLQWLNAMSFRREFSGTMSTNTNAALGLVQTDLFTAGNGRRSGPTGTVVLVTDGRSNINTNQLSPTATAIKDGGDRILVVAYGDNIDLGEVNAIASSPNSENVFIIGMSNDVNSAASQVLDRLCVL